MDALLTACGPPRNGRRTKRLTGDVSVALTVVIKLLLHSISMRVGKYARPWPAILNKVRLDAHGTNGHSGAAAAVRRHRP